VANEKSIAAGGRDGVFLDGLAIRLILRIAHRILEHKSWAGAMRKPDHNKPYKNNTLRYQMAAKVDIPDALIISGDGRIETLLKQKDTVVQPASSCRFDGFVNDTFTEYANPSIYRPASVCRAKLVSNITDTIRDAGDSHLGFTMYTTAGQNEAIDVYIGHRHVATAQNPDPDNRVHLFVVPERFPFRGGEPVRFVTHETTGPCRIENIVLLPKKPPATKQTLDIATPHVDIRTAEEGLYACISFITNRPCSGTLRWGGQKASETIQLSTVQANHEVVLANLPAKRSFQYEIQLTDRTGNMTASCKGRFRTDISQPQSKVKKSRIAIRRRRPGNASPVSVGVPFSKSALGQADKIRILQNRIEVPVQARALTHWDDGSVKWALLDFAADGQSDYTAEFGRDVKPVGPDEPLDVVESKRDITVTTGPIRVEFHRDKLALPGIVSIRQPDGSYQWITPGATSPAVHLTDDRGQVFSAEKAESLTVEEAGSERACIRIVSAHHLGTNRTCLKSVFRIHLYRNSGCIRILHTFENDVKDPFTTIRSLSLRADFDLGGHPTGQIEGQSVDLTKSPLLKQTHDNTFLLTEGRKTLSKGQRAVGAAHLSGKNATVSFGIRDFWQNYPKGLSVDSAGFTIQLCPPLQKDQYPKGGELEDRLYYYVLDGQYKFRQGVSRTHEFWFDVQSDTSDILAETVQNPPLYCVDLDAFNKSQSVTLLPGKDPSPFPLYEKWVDGVLTAYGEDRKESRAYGMLNFGDWFGERTYNWGNLEYDTPWCFLQEYLRGGDPEFFTYAQEAIGHLIDVDTCHHGPQTGQQYTHCVGHVGSYYPDGYRERAIFKGDWKPSHTWVEGPFLYHLLTGEPRALEGAMKTCDLLVGDILNDYDFTNCRNSGWHLIHLAAAYKTTGRRVYLNAARIIVDRVLERQRDSGGWDRLMVPGHCYCHPPRHMGNAGFMVGILMVGLKRYHEATGEKRVTDAIVRAADYCIDSLWVNKTKSFHYTSCPESSISGGADMRILKGIAYAYGFSKKTRFKNVLTAGIKTALGRPPKAHRGIGKGISSPMRGASQVLVNLPSTGRVRAKK
jgi:hypothetical protein